MAIQIGDETEFNQGGKNSGTLLVEDATIDSAEIRTAGYETSAAIELNRVTLIHASVFGEYPRSEPITLRNATIQTSTVTSDSYNKGITVEDSTVHNTSFRMGCCGANLRLIRSDVFNSNFADFNNFYDVEIVDSNLTNSPINLPQANTLLISGTTIDSSGIISNPLTIGNGTIKESLIKGGGTNIGIDISGQDSAFARQTTIVSSTVANFDTGIKVTESGDLKIEGSNLAGFSIYAIDNRTSSSVDATQNYWSTTDTSTLDLLIFDQKDDLNSGLVDYSSYLYEASSDAPDLPDLIPALAMFPASSDLGAVTVGNTASKSVTFLNNSSAPIEISDIVSSNPRFAVNPTSFPLLAGTSQTATISFSPVVTGAVSAEILITHDAAGDSATINAFGTGVGSQCTSVGGVINANTTWTTSSSPYCLTDAVQVANGIELTIEPGVRIQYETDHEILVKGTLTALGSAADPIIFDGLGETARLLIFKDANLADSTLAYTQFKNAQRAIQIGDETEFDQGEKNIGTLNISNLEVNAAEIRTAGYDTGARLVINGATFDNATVFGEYPRSEPITINDAVINDSQITSDSYNKGIILNRATISNTQLTIGCCNANFTIENSTVTNSSISDYNDSYDIIFRNTLFFDTDISLNQAATFVIEDSILSHTGDGGLELGMVSYTSSPLTMERTLVSGDGSGIGLQMTSGYLAISDSTIANFTTGIQLANTSGSPSIKGSNLVGHLQFAIENLSASNVNAAGNYFGTADQNQIAALVYDKSDDSTKGTVNTNGFLSDANPDAPDVAAGTTPQISPKLPDFGGVMVGTTQSISLTVTNNGLTPMAVTSVEVSGEGYSANTTPLTVPANGTEIVVVTFSPSITGVITGALNLHHSGAGGIVRLPLRGLGLNIACTSVQGTISQDTIWDITDQPYCVTNELSVSAAATLKIKPDATILWAGPYDMIIEGSIQADGLPSEPIIFDTIDGLSDQGVTFLKFEGAALQKSTLDHITLKNGERGIHVGDETEFEQGGKNTGTLTITNLDLQNSEIRTGGYETTAAIDISNSRVVSSTVMGEYPQSEPITIRSSSISNAAIQSDSYNKGIHLLDSVISDSDLTIGCCGANFNIVGSTLIDSSITDYNSHYDVEIIDSRLISTAVNLPYSGNVLVSGSTIEHGTSAGVRGENITVQHSIITGNGSGVGVELMDGGGTVISTTIRNHASNVSILDAADWDNVVLYGNNLYENSGNISVQNLSRQPIDAGGNYWGTVDLAAIESAIFDYYDDGYYGIVDYSNFLNAPTPVPAAPTTGVRLIDPVVGLTMIYTDTKGSAMTLTIPPNAVNQDTLLVYVPLTNVPDHIDYAFASRAFMLLAYQDGVLAEDIAFLDPVTITFEYVIDNGERVKLSEEEKMLPELAHWDGERWISAACGDVLHDDATNLLSIEFCTSGQHALFDADNILSQNRLFLPVITN
ncbi:MAG: choice-of-anchor D domain-containing protein [Chloroflexota bacterium]